MEKYSIFEIKKQIYSITEDSLSLLQRTLQSSLPLAQQENLIKLTLKQINDISRLRLIIREGIDDEKH